MMQPRISIQEFDTEATRSRADVTMDSINRYIYEKLFDENNDIENISAQKFIKTLPIHLSQALSLFFFEFSIMDRYRFENNIKYSMEMFLKEFFRRKYKKLDKLFKELDIEIDFDFKISITHYMDKVKIFIFPNDLISSLFFNDCIEYSLNIYPASWKNSYFEDHIIKFIHKHLEIKHPNNMTDFKNNIEEHIELFRHSNFNRLPSRFISRDLGNEEYGMYRIYETPPALRPIELSIFQDEWLQDELLQVDYKLKKLDEDIM